MKLKMAERVWKGEPIPEFKLFQEKFPRLSEEFTELVRETLEESKLERKIQELVIIALLAGKFEGGFKFHLKEAIRHGATREEVAGTILLTLPYCDVATFLKSLAWAKEEGIL
ncbi:MAG: carboxymuconolactone decarboxylase family protein [Candidatus Hecatellaceae archaeon]